jgi:TetR/AcrR family tetracycline transcriptional repressor
MGHADSASEGRTMLSRPPPAVGRLEASAVVAAALDIARDNGVEAITMRALGERLGVSAMALYHHVPTKEDIVKLVSDAVLAQIRVPEPPTANWRYAIVDTFVQYREAVSAYPGLAAVLLRGGLLPRARELVGWSLEVLELAGFTPVQARRLYASVHIFVLGRLTADEARRSRANRAASQHRDDRVEAYLAELHSEDGFREGLELILDGYEKRYGVRPRG